MSFLEELVKKGIIKQNQVGEIKTRAKEKWSGDIEDALIEGGVPEGDILEAKGGYLQMPVRKNINVKDISFAILKYIPEDSANYYHFVPIGFKDGVLDVGVLDGEDTQALDALQFISSKLGIPFKIFLISKSDYKAVLEAYRGMTSQVEEALDELKDDIADSALDGGDLAKAMKGTKPNEESKIVEDAPVIKIVAVMLSNAIEGNASDIHIEHTGEKVKVRFRVDGSLFTSIVLPLNVHSGIVARIKILAKLRLDEKRKPQDGSFSTNVSGRKVDFRVSTMPAYYGEKVVMRILDSEKGVKSLDQLGLSKVNLNMIKEILTRPYGIILITGPTGSGKSTTLYSMLNHLNKEENNIVSLEDPVEYHIPDINQSQVMPEIGYTFASGLRSILRQDPDIIMVGEIRDKETAQLAIQAALTGHLVLATLHTNNAIGAVPRLVDMGVDPYLIAPTLILSMAQRLAKLTYPASRKEIQMDPSIKMMIKEQFKDLSEEYRSDVLNTDKMYDIVPAPECPSGTKGRIAVFEMFKIDKEMEAIILKNPNGPNIFAEARRKGMLTMKEDAIIKSLQGTIPFQEVYRFGDDNE